MGTARRIIDKRRKKVKPPRSSSHQNRSNKPAMSEATSEKEDPKIPPRQFFQHTNVYNCMVDESAPVETQLEQLKARYIALAHNIGQFFDEEEFLTSHTPDEWARTMPAYWPKEFHYAWYCAGAFSHNWAYKSLSDMKWTKAQKKQLVASLDGYIVQEDFDSIISRLSHRDCSGFPDRLATAFLMKRVIKEFFQHPFWYVEVLLEGREISGDAEWQGVSPYGVVLEDLFAQFQTVNIQYARIWRSLTTRLCNQKDRPADYEKNLRARRWARCRSLAQQLLVDNVFKHLLKPTTDLAARENLLARELGQISDIAANMHSQNPCLRYHTLHDLSPRFDRASGTMKAYTHVEVEAAEWQDRWEGGQGIDTSLDGRRPLLIEHPYVFRVGNLYGVEEEEMAICPAPAILEDPEASENKDH
ncbi:hypothetical protein ASPCAL02879 [Aspergillus calidoustus]|uniref:Uncharacterized protein n=1 Tax=Aspergillus calidoustus TaxID=454130 RepID=A0A0U5GTP4_ASPCI|nr:hypothetical protein ASPCAL02879 [Aspergillus calidoustus]